MTVLMLENSLNVTVECTKMLTRIARMLDGTPLQWRVVSDTSVVVLGKKELLYELLLELTKIYLGKIEII